MSFNRSFFLITFFVINFFIYIKRLKIHPLIVIKMIKKDIKVILKKKKKKRDNTIVNNTKIYQKMKNKSWLSIEKNTIK